MAKGDWTFRVLVIFVLLWSYTEISEYRDRDAFQENVSTFMSKGNRFTKQRGDELEKRVEELEKKANP